MKILNKNLHLFFLNPLQGVITDEGKSSGCLTSAPRDAAASISTTMFSVKRLRVVSWRPASSRKGPFTASPPAPAHAWCLATLITTPSTASSTISRALAPTCLLGLAGRWQGCPTSVWRPRMRTVAWPQFPGSGMSQWMCMVTESYYPKAV